MENLTLIEIINAVQGSYGYPAQEIVSSICTDTRELDSSKKCLFVALKGENFDGHNFVEQALSQGAVAAITNRPILGSKCIIVDDTRKALLDIASYYRNKFDIELIGITGSVGKTTTKEMVSLVLESEFSTLKTLGNLNNEIGLPKTLFRLENTHKCGVLEMGMSDFGEISRLSMCARPTISIITNIGYSHIENLGSVEGILKAKMEILDGMDYSSPIILNGDDKLLYDKGLELRNSRNITFYGIQNKKCDYYASNIKTSGFETEFDINYDNKVVKAKLNCIGSHNVLNAVAAFVTGKLLNISDEVIVSSLLGFKPDNLRQNIVQKGEQLLIIDCYNASPDSMKSALAVLSEINPENNGRRIAVLGDMFELGSKAKQLHKKVGTYVKNSKAEILVCVGENAINIKNGFDNEKSVHFEDKNDAISYLKEILQKDDVVLFKASRGMKFEEIIDGLYKD